ncbi:MAG: hypothetical protein WC986_14135 [Elusimicrobiota bacterium]|jgi:hypothetical protein
MTMRRLTILLAAICLLTGHEYAQAKTRDQVVADARAMLSISTWTATGNVYEFSSTVTFQSHFLTDVEYSSWPYVYGGKIDGAETSRRINDGMCPGGKNVTEIIPPGRNTPVDTEWLLDHGFNPAQHLAGIDCSGFACRALGDSCIGQISNTNTTELAALSVKIDQARMRPGDMLIRVGKHVRVVASTGSQLQEVLEAIGSDVGAARWAFVSVGSYGVYTPFPSYSNLVPADGSSTDNGRPAIKARVWSGTVIRAGDIELRVNGSSVTFSVATTPDVQYYDVSYTPSVALSSGAHTVSIRASNTLGLEDSATWTFTVGDFRPYLSSVRAAQGGSAVYASQWTASGAGMKLGSSYPKEASSESGIAVHLGFSKSMSPLEEVSLDGVAASTVYTVDPSSRDWRAIFSSTAVSGFGKSAPLRLTVRGKDLAGNSLLRTAEDRSLPDMSALSSAITANGGADEVHRLHPPYYLTATPLIQPIPIFIPWIRHSNSRRTAPRRVGKATPHQIFRLE